MSLYERLSLRVLDSFEFRWSVAMSASNLGQALAQGPEADWPEAGGGGGARFPGPDGASLVSRNRARFTASEHPP